MFAYLEKLQRMPKAKRRFTAFAVAGSATLIIFTIWIAGLEHRLGTMRDENEQRLTEGVSPFASFRRSATELIAGAKERIGDFKDVAASLVGSINDTGEDEPIGQEGLDMDERTMADELTGADVTSTNLDTGVRITDESFVEDPADTGEADEFDRLGGETLDE